MATSAKSVLITGCSSGIGKALALEFHHRGLHVLAASRSLASVTDLSDAGIDTVQLDPTSASSINAAREAISKATGGKLDILVNNAGTYLEKPAIETEIDKVKALFDINVFAVMAMINEFIPLLIAAKGGGTIVNHGSMVRSLPLPFTAAYNASKAAVSQYSHTLRIELEPLGVEVIELVSGRVATGLVTVPTMDETSIYKPLEPLLQTRAREAETQQKAEVFAKAAAKSILEKPGNIEVFKGSIATIAWAITMFAPRWVINAAVGSLVGLGDEKLRGAIAERAAARSKT